MEEYLMDKIKELEELKGKLQDELSNIEKQIEEHRQIQNKISDIKNKIKKLEDFIFEKDRKYYICDKQEVDAEHEANCILQHTNYHVEKDKVPYYEDNATTTVYYPYVINFDIPTNCLQEALKLYKSQLEKELELLL